MRENRLDLHTVLKNHQYIFLFLFLGSIFFSAFQYLPIFEEDTQISKTLSKKSGDSSSENDTPDDDSDDDEGDGDEDDFLHENYLEHFNLICTGATFNTHTEKFRNIFFSINTPPPKI